MTEIRPIPAALGRSVRLGVLLSGGGTTMLNFLEKMAEGTLNAEIPIVIASRPDCKGIQRAQDAGLKCEVVSRKDYASVTDFSKAIFELMREANVDLVTLAGFLSLLEIPEDFSYRVMNIHPALIPSFCGKGFYGHHVHEAVVNRGVKVTGCTVHFADNVYDHGPIIVQKAVPVLSEDSPDDVAARVFEAECEAYPEAINRFAAGEVVIHDRRVL